LTICAAIWQRDWAGSDARGGLTRYWMRKEHAMMGWSNELCDSRECSPSPKSRN
jgi:hypothetical protein